MKNQTPSEPEHSCELKRTKMTRNPQSNGTVLLAHCEVDNKFCPECGEPSEKIKLINYNKANYPEYADMLCQECGSLPNEAGECPQCL